MARKAAAARDAAKSLAAAEEAHAARRAKTDKATAAKVWLRVQMLVVMDGLQTARGAQATHTHALPSQLQARADEAASAAAEAEAAAPGGGAEEEQGRAEGGGDDAGEEEEE